MEVLTMSESTNEGSADQNILVQSQEYLEAETEGPDHTSRLSDLRDLRSNLKTRQNEYSERFSTDHSLVERVTNKIDTVEAEIEELEEEQQAQKHLKADLLTAFERFELTEEWLQPPVLRALNHALHGSEHDAIIINKTRIEDTDDVEDLTFLERLDIEEKLLRIITDAQEESSHTDEIWEWVQKDDRLQVFATLAREEPADKHHLGKVLGVEPKTAKNKVEYPIYQHGPDLIPYHSQGGTYRLTTPARYVANKYRPFDQLVADDQDSEGVTYEHDEETQEDGTLSSFTYDEDDEDVTSDGEDGDE